MDSEPIAILKGRRFSVDKFEITHSHLDFEKAHEDMHGRACFQYKNWYKGTATLCIEPNIRISFNWITIGGEDEWNNGDFDVDIDWDNPQLSINDPTLLRNKGMPLPKEQLEDLLIQIVEACALCPIKSLITQKFIEIKPKVMKKHFGALTPQEKKYLKHPLS